MSKLDNKNTMPRYSVIIIVMILVGFAILGKVVHTMTVKRPYWEKVFARLKVDSMPDPAQRGNILSCDGQLMASTLPEYRIFMDFKAGGFRKTAMFEQAMDTLCDGLHHIFPTMSSDEFRTNIEEGKKKASQHWKLWPGRIDYNTLQELKKMPLFRLQPYQGGFTAEANSARKHPFDRLAIRTLGDIFGDQDEPRSGLELSFDSILRGQPGWRRQMKVRDQLLTTSEKEPVSGADIVTTIDVNIQDLAERCLREELTEIGADAGVAIVMEVKTGDIKAIVNLDVCKDGSYAELRPHAISDLLEPGSVFKTASFLVALDDGKIDTTMSVNCMGGIKRMYGSEMKDWSWRKGGYGILTVPQILQQSSNIGVSTLIDRYYGSDPEKFIEGLHRIGIADNLGLPIPGYTAPKIRGPKDKKNWSKTDLPWMSIGYVTQMPPISTLTFYNTIANNGKMMRPRIVKEIRRDGKTIQEFPPEVMRDNIAKKESIKIIQEMLEKVVSVGLGKRAGSELFKVAGKTGTALIAGSGGYRGGMTRYLLSFCGYFPADKPLYSCIVCIQRAHGGSGGIMGGTVFHNISEGIMAQIHKRKSHKAKQKTSSLIPDVKRGDLRASDIVLTKLGFKTSGDWQNTSRQTSPTIGTATYNKQGFDLKKSEEYNRKIMPNTIGMGARDAVYMLESRGIKVNLQGRGKVVEQSIPAGNNIKKGEQCSLRLG